MSVEILTGVYSMIHHLNIHKKDGSRKGSGREKEKGCWEVEEVMRGQYDHTALYNEEIVKTLKARKIAICRNFKVLYLLKKAMAIV